MPYSEKAEKAWIHCLKIEATIRSGNRACMHRRHDPHLLRFGREFGFKTLLEDIRNTNFTMLDYFYKRRDQGESRWEKQVDDKKQREWRALKELDETERLTEGHTSWDRNEELKRIQNEHGPRSPQAVEFAGKWDLAIK